MNQLRSLHLRGALGAVKTEMWNGREHLVVPMVALMEGVIHAVNARTAEFVSAAALRASVDKWAGHPIVVGHPTRDGKQISAHEPEVLGKHCGFIRSSTMNGNRLVHETLIDPARLRELGHQALEQDLRAGKGAEVSVGAFVTTNDTKGKYSNKLYDGEWVEIGPDHTALLPGGIGACSIEMGCGAHRAAMLVTAEGFEVVDMKQPLSLKSLKDRILALFDTPEQQQSEEDAELIKWQSMRATHDSLGAAWDEVDSLIDELIEAEATHVAGSAEDAETEIEAAKLDAIRMHCMAMSGAVGALMSTAYQTPSVTPSRYMEAFKALIGKTISAKNMKVIQSSHDATHDMHTQTVALGAQCNGMKLLAKQKDCPTCEGTGQVTEDGKQSDCPTCDGSGLKTLKAACRCDSQSEEAMKTKAERIAALLKHEHNTAKDLKTLETVSEDVLTILETQADAATKFAADVKAAQDAEAKAKADLKAASEHVPTEEEYLKLAPESIRTLVAEKKASDAAQKTTLVAQLKTAAKDVYTDAELDAMPLSALSKLAQLVKVEAPADFSGRGVPVPRGASTEDYSAPNPYEAGIKALQAKVN